MSKVREIFTRVFHETELRFVFEIRHLRLADDWLTFYIKPEDGLELPRIMKWLPSPELPIPGQRPLG